MSPEELVNRISCNFIEYDIPEGTAGIMIKERMTGKNFERLKSDYIHLIFPQFNGGNKLSFMTMKDDVCHEEQKQQLYHPPGVLIELPTSPDEHNEEQKPRYRETFRKFDQEAKFCYHNNGELTSSVTRPSNLIDPVHVFSNLQLLDDESYINIANEVIEFAAACLSSRSNGTIHFGVHKLDSYPIKGYIQGLPIDQCKCSDKIYRTVEERFYNDQHSLVLKCIRPPQFIKVTSKENLNTKFVLEVDVVPASALIREEAFFIKGKGDGRPLLFELSNNCIKSWNLADEETRKYMSKSKNLLADYRRDQERRPKEKPVKKDLREKLLDLISFGEEEMSAEIYPLVFLSPFDSSNSNNIGMSNFEFLLDLNANAFFDFDYSANNKGLYYFIENEKSQVLKALTTDNFDPESTENKRKKDSLSNLIDDILTSALKPWIFCNGYEDMHKEPMTMGEWKNTRSKGLKEAIRFYYKEIPCGRALIIFLLFSKNYDIMLEIAEEVMLTFQHQWVVIAENEDIANHWCTQLIQRETVNRKVMERRCVLGMPWSHINQTIKQLTGSRREIRCEIPTSKGAFCHLTEKKRNELDDLAIISRNECDDPEITNDRTELEKMRRTVEEKFYKGEEVSWWNFWFIDLVLKRDVHKRLTDKILNALDGGNADEDNKIGLVNIYHQPGAGGTTTTMHVLWELRERYRCCILKKVTDQTVDQIASFRNYEDGDDPTPPLIMIDNLDEEKLGDLFANLQHRAKIVARRSSDMKVFCVLLLCTRRPVIPLNPDEASVFLRHELSNKELDWFRRKHSHLLDQFRLNQRPDPKFLISFNILKENFSMEYIQRTAKELVKGVEDSDERTLLKYLSLLNTYDLECQSIPLSAFDCLMMTGNRGYTITYGLTPGRMGKRLNKAWEQTISQPLQVLINRNFKARLGGQLMGLSIINQLFSKQIFACFNQPPVSTSGIFKEFLDSSMCQSSNMSGGEVIKIVKNLVKRREENKDSVKEKFSPLIMHLLEFEDGEKAAEILIKVFNMTYDAMICQQIARLYIHIQNWSEASEFAKIATDMKPQNSYLWDTYGQVHKCHLLKMYLDVSTNTHDYVDCDFEEAVQIAALAMHKFRQEHQVSEDEHASRSNDAGFYAELKIIILLLDLLRYSPLGQKKEVLHKYLTDKDFLPDESSQFTQESVDFLKGLEERAETTVRTIEEKTTQLKDDMFYSTFGRKMPLKSDIASLRENLDSYFGEDCDYIPELLSEQHKAAYRRRRVRRIGGTSLSNYLHIEPLEMTTKLNQILEMLLENVRSDYWEVFDIINLINVVIAMRILKVHQEKVTFAFLTQCSKKCYERMVSVSSTDTRLYLEAYMYYVIFNWPTELRSKSSLCSVEQLLDATKKWREAFHTNHPRQKESRPIRKKETTSFFLGKGIDMNAVVHYLELKDPWGKKFVKSDKIWETPDFIHKLLRLKGTLTSEGTEVLCEIEPSPGRKFSFRIPTSFPIGVRSLWQKGIFFVLGFSWSGIKAYDVRQDKPEEAIPLLTKEIPSRDQRGVGHQKESNSRKTGGQKFQTHDEFIDLCQKIKDQMDKIDDELIGFGVGKEKVGL